MMRFPVAILIALSLACAGCAGTPATPVPSPGAPASYRLGIGDRIRIDTYNEPKLSGEFVVDGDGTLAFPLVGRVAAGGETLAGLSAKLTQTLASGGYLLHPSVAVQMVTFRPVFILGEVERPGQYPYVEHMTIYTLVAQAGGFTYRASKHEIGLRHDGESAERKLRVGSGTAIAPGDTIRVLERYF